MCKDMKRCQIDGWERVGLINLAAYGLSLGLFSIGRNFLGRLPNATCFSQQAKLQLAQSSPNSTQSALM